MNKINKYFYRSEFACRCGCGFDVVDVELLSVLEDLRDYFKQPVIITGPNRCYKHNIEVGGAENSMHVMGKGVDFGVIGVGSQTISEYLEKLYPDKYGIGIYSDRIHLDVRQERSRWNGRK